jgi:hypothetical protein
MTPDEARAVLASRPPHMRTREWLENQIRYEQREGVHTYSRCPCGRAMKRISRCPQCLREMLSVAKE